MAIDVVTLALANQYTEESLLGAGALKGNDGFSPSVSVTETKDGAEISITDSSHTETFEIKNGRGIPTGGVDGQVLTRVGSETQWKDPEEVSFPEFIQCTL